MENIFIKDRCQLVSTTSSNPDVQDAIGTKGMVRAQVGHHLTFMTKNQRMRTSTVVEMSAKGHQLSVVTKSGTTYTFRFRVAKKRNV